MKKSKKKVHLIDTDNNKLSDSFESDCSLINYTKDSFDKISVADINLLDINSTNNISWLNIYGFRYQLEMRKIIYKCKLDEFLINLTLEGDHRNKVVELTDSFFLTLKSLELGEKEKADLEFEQMMFVVSKDFVWSVQEKRGDHFEHIRTRLKENNGVVREKGSDYLLYLIIESIIDNYNLAYEELVESNQSLLELGSVNPNPEYVKMVETSKKNLFQIKKAVGSLREAINQILKIDMAEFDTKYFAELKEQINYVNDNIDFNLQQLESSINLVFSIQSHRLNEVMKTLTVLSVIFIPLTFLAGIYGMNFKNMPELNTKYGYFILLAVMALVTISTIFYFKRKKWFK